MLQTLASVTILTAAMVAGASAQTAAPIFRSWEWVEEPHSVRTAGLAGAVAAEPPDASAAVLYPAGLSLVSEPALHLSIRHTGSEPIAADRSRSQWAPGEVAFALPLGSRWGLAAYYRERRHLDLEFQDEPRADRPFDEGRIAATSDEMGVAAGYAALPWLRLGLRVGLARADFQAEVTTRVPSGPAPPATLDLRDETPRFGAGLLFAPEQRFQAGLEFDSKASWSGGSVTSAEETPHGLVSPARLALGVLYRPSTPIQVLAQVERVGWSAVMGSTYCCGGSSAAEYVLEDATDARLGLELRFGIGDFGIWNRLAVRAGVHIRSRGLVEYVGEDPAQRARFPGMGRSTDWSVGLACGRLEVTGIIRKQSSVWVFGVRQVF